jgi:hypothetical protein
VGVVGGLPGKEIAGGKATVARLWHGGGGEESRHKYSPEAYKDAFDS